MVGVHSLSFWRTELLAERVKVMANPIVWVDIPCRDLDRAIGFYSAVLGCSVKKEEFPNFSIGVLPHGSNEVGACLFVKVDAPPSDRGPLLYLNCEGRLDDAVAAVSANGGTVLQPRQPIGPYGHRAIILDSEGNRLALHSS
jgi:predicted enzyme related to lactoylglutathione lyase